MERNELISALQGMIVQECNLEIPPNELAANDQLIGGQLMLDSLDALQIAVAIKAEYGVRISTDPAGRKAMQSVESLADFIIEARNGAQ